MTYIYHHNQSRVGLAVGLCVLFGLLLLVGVLLIFWRCCRLAGSGQRRQQQPRIAVIPQSFSQGPPYPLYPQQVQHLNYPPPSYTEYPLQSYPVIQTTQLQNIVSTHHPAARSSKVQGSNPPGTQPPRYNNSDIYTHHSSQEPEFEISV